MAAHDGRYAREENPKERKRKSLRDFREAITSGQKRNQGGVSERGKTHCLQGATSESGTNTRKKCAKMTKGKNSTERAKEDFVDEKTPRLAARG